MSTRSSFKDLREFIQALDDAGELVRIQEPVSPELEISEIYLREIEKGEAGKALLFENVIGSDIPVLINSMGSFKRMKIAFGGMSFDEIAAELKSFLQIKPPTGFGEKIDTVMQLSQVRKFLPKTVRKAPCQEVVLTGDDVELTKFPILKTWPEDGGPYITLPLVFTKNVDGTLRNCGMYRMQVYDQKTTGMHWQIHHDGSNFFYQHREAGKERMEVAVAIGSDPSLPFSAIAPMPPVFFEMLIAGFIRQKPVEMVQCKTIDMEVPAHAEIVLEGYVDPNELREEGPFGDHTGYYTLEADYPVFHVTAITHRKNPIYQTTVVGRSPQEDCYFGGKATERIFLPMFQMIAHEVQDMILPWDGCFHNCNIIAMKKSFPLHARRLMSQVWGQGQASTCKAVITTDADATLSDDEHMVEYILDRLHIPTNVFVTEGVVDALDHSSYQWAYGGKVGIDVTRAVPGEPNFGIDFPKITRVRRDESTRIRELQLVSSAIIDVRVIGAELKNTVYLIRFDKSTGGTIQQISDALFNADISEEFDIVAVVDERTDLSDDHQVMWRLFNNTDWKEDTYFNRDRNKLIVDSTYKIAADGFHRRWPGDLIMTDAVKKRVDEILEKVPELT